MTETVGEVLLLPPEPIGPFTAGAQRRVVGKVAEKVEGIGRGLSNCLREGIDIDPSLFELLDDLRTPRRVELICRSSEALGYSVRTLSPV